MAFLVGVPADENCRQFDKRSLTRGARDWRCGFSIDFGRLIVSSDTGGM